MLEGVHVTDDYPNEDDEFPIVAVVKAKNGALWKLVKQCGSQAALARRLGLGERELGLIINMKWIPPFSNPKWQAVEEKMMAQFGVNWDDVVPPELRSKEFLDAPKTVEIEHEVSLARLSSYGAGQFLLPSAMDVVASEEAARIQTEKIEAVLSTLPYRIRCVIQLRYGLFGGDQMTLSEVGEVMHTTRENVRQMEAKGIRLMQEPVRSSHLIDCIPER